MQYKFIHSQCLFFGSGQKKGIVRSARAVPFCDVLNSARWHGASTAHNTFFLTAAKKRHCEWINLYCIPVYVRIHYISQHSPIYRNRILKLRNIVIFAINLNDLFVHYKHVLNSSILPVFAGRFSIERKNRR
jgi:hypothetical protein